MASNKRGKRKSGSKNLIFEVSDGELSEEECDNEPQTKVMKFCEEELLTNSIDVSNLGSDNKESFEKETIISVSDEDTVIEGSKFERTVTQETTDSGIGNSEGKLDLSELLQDGCIVIEDTNDNDENVPDRTKSEDGVINNETDLDNTEVICIGSENVTEDSIDKRFEIVSADTQKLDANSKKSKKVDIKKKEAKIIAQDNTDSGETDTDTSICISFNNKQCADLYKFKFIKFLESFVELETVFEDDLTIRLQRDSLLSPTEWLVLDETYLSQNIEDEKLASPLPITPPKKKKKKKKEKKEKDLFILDTTPSRSENSVLYSSKFEISERNEDDEAEKVKVKQAIVCFNCGDAHALRDCPQKKDQAKIQAARMKMMKQKQKNSRYHLDTDQVYAHLAPGKMSYKLREALDLNKNELPPYIYQMRVLGYPPGWLEEAKVVYSNLDLIDMNGKTVKHSKATQGLDPAKIVEYPGFNVPMEKHVKDAYKNYQVPPYSKAYSKNIMIEYFEKQFEKLQDDFDTHDMDLDDTANEKYVCSPKPQESKELKLKNPKIEKMKGVVEVGSPSPTLTDLEKQKERLLAALEDNTSSNIASEENTIEASVVENAESAQGEQKVSTPLHSPAAKIIQQSNVGTPILKSSSPYLRLPHLDNFTKDVACTLIHFENLPNSTGKYEKMRQILRKVRDNAKDSQNQQS